MSLADEIEKRLDPGPTGSGVRYATFSVLLNCRLCGGGLPLQGPLRTVRCPACQGETHLKAERIATYLSYLPMKVGEILGELKWTHHDSHSCSKCGRAVDLASIPVGAESVTPCSGCGTGLVSFPPPAWLKEQLPALVQLYDAEREPGDAPPTAVPAVVPAKSAPVVMKCPSCAGSLKINADSPRMTTCEFCQASVYLPDDLWRALHPVKRAATWTIAFVGRLQTLADLRGAERKAAQEAAEREAQRVAAEKKQLEDEALARAGVAEGKKLDRQLLLGTLGGLLLIGLLLYLMVRAG